MKVSHLYHLLAAVWLISCDKPAKVEPSIELPSFNETPAIVSLDDQLLHGASGIADALNFDRAVWVHNDHDPHLYLLSYEGELLRKLPFEGTSRDWEDMASGPGPKEGVNYLYIGEVGDNAEIYGHYRIYRFPEPTPDQERIDAYDDIEFTYPDGKSYDVETLLLDPLTKDLYLLTKRQIVQAHIFRLPYPQKTDQSNLAEHVATIPYGMFTSGDISRDGKEVLLKNYTNIFYWKIREGESLSAALKRPHDLPGPYQMEPQGEAICFDKNAAGYFTISEKANSPDPVKLYYYRKD